MPNEHFKIQLRSHLRRSVKKSRGKKTKTTNNYNSTIHFKIHQYEGKQLLNTHLIHKTVDIMLTKLYIREQTRSWGCKHIKQSIAKMSADINLQYTTFYLFIYSFSNHQSVLSIFLTQSTQMYKHVSEHIHKPHAMNNIAWPLYYQTHIKEQQR